MVDFTKPVVTADGKCVVIDTRTAAGPYPVIGHIENNPRLYRWSRMGTPELFDTPNVKQAVTALQPLFSSPTVITHRWYVSVYADVMGRTRHAALHVAMAACRKGKTKLGVIETIVEVEDGVVKKVDGRFIPGASKVMVPSTPMRAPRLLYR